MALQIQINKTFLKELSQIPSSSRIRIENFVFKESGAIKKLNDIPNIQKLKGYKHYYRIRFGEYRAGISFRNEVLTFERILHRKDLYKYFP